MVDVVFFGLNRFGEKIYNWLLDRDDANVMALITHQSQYQSVRKLDPELIISAGFRSIIPDKILNLPELGAVNLHPSYLPYNRGANPNVWSIIEDSPAGVSIHYMTPDVDKGPMIARKKVPIFPDDDGKSLYRRLEQEQVKLFRDNWREIRDGSATTKSQENRDGSFHYKHEFQELFELDLQEEATLEEFIDRLRALTFPPYNNAYFVKNGEKYFVEINITPESETESTDGIHFNIPVYD